ncbi:unnamed protein product, partial [Phaeothamnion confervicola]
WYNVRKEIYRGRQLRCFFCRDAGREEKAQRGATIGCDVSSCQVASHLGCALSHG